MKITQEADYAIRICSILDSVGEKTGAQKISELAGITPQITLKNLRKLVRSGIVRSYKGSAGGYELAKSGDKITVLEIIQAIEGKVKISKCLDGDYCCSRNQCKTNCKMHLAFCVINKQITENLGKIKISMLNDESLSAVDIADIINQK